MKSVKLEAKEITVDGVEYLQFDLSQIPTDKNGFINWEESYLQFGRKPVIPKSINDAINSPKINDKIINIPK